MVCSVLWWSSSWNCWWAWGEGRFLPGLGVAGDVPEGDWGPEGGDEVGELEGRHRGPDEELAGYYLVLVGLRCGGSELVWTWISMK